jgi:hypothetical protein
MDEEDDMFPKAKAAFDRDTIIELSEKFDEVDVWITQKAR